MKLPVLRSAASSDDEFLFRLYIATRAEELQQTGWNSIQQIAFLRQQFDARRRSYRLEFPGAETSVILLGRTAAGAMIVARTDQEIRLVDIVLWPEHRRAGLGTVLLDRLQVEARHTGRPLRLSVQQSNPARRLYERLGFTPVGMAADYIRMEWRAPAD